MIFKVACENKFFLKSSIFFGVFFSPIGSSPTVVALCLFKYVHFLGLNKCLHHAYHQSNCRPLSLSQKTSESLHFKRKRREDCNIVSNLNPYTTGLNPVLVDICVFNLALYVAALWNRNNLLHKMQLWTVWFIFKYTF